MIALGLELVTVTDPIPPDFSTGETRHPFKLNEIKVRTVRKRQGRVVFISIESCGELNGGSVFGFKRTKLCNSGSDDFNSTVYIGISGCPAQ